MNARPKSTDIHALPPSIQTQKGKKISHGTPSAYHQIAQTLLACEASSYQVGIPWLPPTSRVKGCRKRFQPPLLEFVKQQLCSVNSQNISSYCHLLESNDNDPETLERLEIQIRQFERYAFASGIFAIALLAGLSFTLRSALLPVEAIAISTLVSCLLGSSALTSSSDRHRRDSFAWLLNQELTRRCGGNAPAFDRVAITPDPDAI